MKMYSIEGFCDSTLIYLNPKDIRATEHKKCDRNRTKDSLLVKRN